MPCKINGSTLKRAKGKGPSIADREKEFKEAVQEKAIKAGSRVRIKREYRDGTVLEIETPWTLKIKWDDPYGQQGRTVSKGVSPLRVVVIPG